MSTAEDWKPSEREVLDVARAQRDIYGYNAGRMQTRFRRLQRSIVWVGVWGALMVVLQAQFSDSLETKATAGPSLTASSSETEPAAGTEERPDAKKTALGELTHGLIVLIPILLAMLVSAATHYRPGEKWIVLRTAAESTKAEIFKFRTRTGIYASEVDRAKEFAAATAAMVPNDLPTLKQEKKEESTEEASSPGDDGTSPLDANGYLALRLQEQLDWYWGKIIGFQEQSDHRHILIWIFGGLGTALAAFGFDLWIAVTVAIAGAFSAMLEYEQTDATREQYSSTVAKLMKVKLGWAGLPLDQREAGFPKLVADTEKIFEAEHTDFATRIQETLAQMKKLREAEELAETDGRNEIRAGQGS